MVKPTSNIPEEMVSLAQTLVETESLRSWFFALEAVPVAIRSAAFAQMAAQMRSEGEDPPLSAAVASLVRPSIYESVLQAVRERCR